MKRRVLSAAIIAIMIGIVGGCASVSESHDDLPAYVFRSEAALKGYRAALDNRGLLSRLPCYCGCGQDPQYSSLADCFFDPAGGYNSHAANCAVCLEEAEDAAAWRKEGMYLAQIRSLIDSKYEERGPATKTPPSAPGEEIAE